MIRGRCAACCCFSFSWSLAKPASRVRRSLEVATTAEGMGLLARKYSRVRKGLLACSCACFLPIGVGQGLDFKEGSFRPFRSAVEDFRSFQHSVRCPLAKAFPHRLTGCWHGLPGSWQGRRPCGMMRALAQCWRAENVRSLKYTVSQHCLHQDVIKLRRLRWSFPKGGYEAGVGLVGTRCLAYMRLDRCLHERLFCGR